MNSLLGHALAFEHRMARQSATEVRDLPWGFLVRTAAFPTSVQDNRLVVVSNADPHEVVAAAETFLADAPHRAVAWDWNTSGEAVGVFEDAGYEASGEVVMCLDSDATVSPSGDARRVEGRELDDATTAFWIRAGMTPEGAACLAARRVLREAAADVEYYAVERDGRFVSHCELYVHGATAQVETLLTDPAYQRQGLAREVVMAATTRARHLDCDLVFLRTDADDWPQHFYRQLGFQVVGHAGAFSRAPLANDS